jgi:hypothetical protein
MELSRSYIMRRTLLQEWERYVVQMEYIKDINANKYIFYSP